jgi:hypothetical protein
MPDFKKIAKKLGLEDIGEATIGEETCRDCGTKLRFGEDKYDSVWSYCPECQKKIASFCIIRFQPLIKVASRND